MPETLLTDGAEGPFAGRYAIRRFLGRGATKQVYLAYDEKLDREVALCLVIGTPGSAALERVAREAKVMGRLGEHAHIATIYDVGEQGGLPFMVVRYLAGGSLAGALAEAPGGRLSCAHAASIGADVADALAYAHARGIVHRDVKPDNIWLAADGSAHLGDFGVALAAGQERLTLEHAVVGTPSYLSPEQASGTTVGAPADLYALGVTLYKAVSGRPPFAGPDTVAVIAQHLEARPPPLPADVPTGLAELILGLLAKAPEQRPDAEAVRHALGAGARPPAPPAPGFVGREPLLARLDHALAAALGSHGHPIGITGDPGMGKTRLAEELARRAAARGAFVVWGRCVPDEGAPALWPWTQALTGLRATLGDALGPLPDELHPLLGGRAASAPSEPSAEARFRMFETIVSVLDRAAAAQPTVIVLDDLQWADRSSLDLLAHVTRTPAALPLLVVAGYRSGAAVGRQLADVPAFEPFELAGLSVDEVGRFVADQTGVTAPLEVVAAIHRHTGGSPFFVAELVRMLAGEGRLASEADVLGGAVPTRVRDVVAHRLERLAPETAQVLRAAALIGASFEPGVLAAALGRSRGDVDRALADSAGASLVTREEAGWAFTHVIIRDAVGSQLAEPQRVALHGAIARVLEQRYQRGASVEPGDLARHFVAAARGGRASEPAVRYCRLAAEAATAVHAFEEAAGHYERALAVAEDDDATGVATVCELLLALAAARTSAGGSESGKAAYHRAAEVAGRAGAAQTLARAALGYAEWGPYGCVNDEAVRLLEQAIAALPDADVPVRAAALGRLALRLDPRADQERRERLLAEAVAMAERLGDEDVLANLFAISPLINWRPSARPLRRRHTGEAIELARRSGDRQGELWARIVRFTDSLGEGAVAEAENELHAYDRVAADVGRVYYRWFGMVLRGTYAAFLGELPSAEEVVEGAVAIIRRHDPDCEQEYCVQRFMLARLTGDFSRVPEDDLRRFADRYPDLPMWRALVARLDVAAGRHEPAARTLAALAGAEFSQARRDPDALTTLMLAAEVAAALDDRATATLLRRVLLPYEAHNVVTDRAWAAWGAMARPLGALAATAGDVAAAARHFDRALELNRRWGARAWVAQTLADRAAALPGLTA